MQEEIEGFRVMMIRDVPMGAVLNAATADSYPLIEAGCWLSAKGNWMLFREYDSVYRLVPYTVAAQQVFYNLYSNVVGNKAYCLERFQLISMQSGLL